jgi:intein/homing endonuclease
LPIDPYVLGAWIGDGNSKDSGVLFAENDIEMLEYIESAGYSIGKKRSVTGDNLQLRGIGTRNDRNRDSETLMVKLRQLGLLRNKHIPTQYLRASYSQRLALLQGLMDTDGCAAPTGRCIFTQSKYHIILLVAELIRSLGIKCFIRESSVTHAFGKRVAKKYNRWDITFRTALPVFQIRCQVPFQ